MHELPFLTLFVWMRWFKTVHVRLYSCTSTRVSQSGMVRLSDLQVLLHLLTPIEARSRMNQQGFHQPQNNKDAQTSHPNAKRYHPLLPRTKNIAAAIGKKQKIKTYELNNMIALRSLNYCSHNTSPINVTSNTLLSTNRAFK